MWNPSSTSEHATPLLLRFTQTNHAPPLGLKMRMDIETRSSSRWIRSKLSFFLSLSLKSYTPKGSELFFFTLSDRDDKGMKYLYVVLTSTSYQSLCLVVDNKLLYTVKSRCQLMDISIISFRFLSFIFPHRVNKEESFSWESVLETRVELKSNLQKLQRLACSSNSQRI